MRLGHMIVARRIASFCIDCETSGFKELSENLDCRLHVSSAIVDKIEDKLFHPFFLEILKSCFNFIACLC